MVLHGLAWYYLVWHGITWFGMVWYGIGSSAVRCVGHYLQVPTHPPLTGCDTHTPSAASYPQSTLPSSGPTFFFWHFLLWIIFMWLESFRPRRLAVSFVLRALDKSSWPYLRKEYSEKKRDKHIIMKKKQVSWGHSWLVEPVVQSVKSKFIPRGLEDSAALLID